MECTDHYKICQWDALDVAETPTLAAERFAHRAAMTDAQATYRCHAHGPNYEFEVPHPFPQALGRMLMEPLALAFSMPID